MAILLLPWDEGTKALPLRFVDLDDGPVLDITLAAD
jgi:hypothetical protein